MNDEILLLRRGEDKLSREGWCVVHECEVSVFLARGGSYVTVTNSYIS